MWDFIWRPTCWIEDLNRNPFIGPDVTTFCKSTTCSQVAFVCRGKNHLRLANIESANCICTEDKCDLDLTSHVSCDRKTEKERNNISQLFRSARKPPKPEYACDKPLDPNVKIENCRKKESKRFANIFKKLTFCEVSCQDGKTPSSKEVACEKIGKKQFEWTSSIECL